MMAKLYGKNIYVDKMNFVSQQFIRKLLLLLAHYSQHSRKPADTQFATISCQTVRKTNLHLIYTRIKKMKYVAILSMFCRASETPHIVPNHSLPFSVLLSQK